MDLFSDEAAMAAGKASTWAGSEFASEVDMSDAVTCENFAWLRQPRFGARRR